jgi:pimeloyl-ACP methyl ester carboxylesterase
MFLQGGPGAGAPRPHGRDRWLHRALADYRVLLLDQRGTGRSTPATRQTLARSGSAAEQAGYLAHFRADAIVRDAELVRRAITGGEPWSVLGQSYGGFCTVTYLSLAPEGIREAFITGGLPGLDTSADDVYRLTYGKVAARTRAHYERYPGDADQARRVARHLRDHQVVLPDGAPFTVEAFQTLGLMLGGSTGSDDLHYLIESPFAGDELSDAFLHAVAPHLSFASGPLYAVLHEACYAQGAATRWSAQRIRSEFGEFDPAAAIDGDGPLLFTGEMIYPWMFDTYPQLMPLKEAAEILAQDESWPRLYDVARLAKNTVPVAAAVYYDDMYVHREFSEETARVVPNVKLWITNQYEHNGLRADGEAVVGRLLQMVRGEA